MSGPREHGRLRALAPAKINLGLFVGPVRPHDGRHELASVMQAISLADELTLQASPDRAGADLVICPGVPGDPAENLAARALALFRDATGWHGGALRVDILKRIPVAAGLGGGSADAAATLRLAAAASGLGSRELLLELAARLGADVPAQMQPGRWLATGAGERLRALAAPRASFGVLVLPAASELSTATVYAQADREGRLRKPAELTAIAARMRGALEQGAPVPGQAGLMHNDLQAAAIALRPQIEQTLSRARDAGADVAFVSGSGPTVIGLFMGGEGRARAKRAAIELSHLRPAPVCGEPVGGAFGLPAAVGSAAAAASE